MICIEDIAHSLSMQCRFGGHLPRFYSVAEHSIRCMELAKQEDKLSALLHDASEAYLMDIPRPIKGLIPQYRKLEYNLMKVISEKFNFEFPMSMKIAFIDDAMLEREWNEIMLFDQNREYKEFLTSRMAEDMFLMYFKALTIH